MLPLCQRDRRARPNLSVGSVMSLSQVSSPRKTTKTSDGYLGAKMEGCGISGGVWLTEEDDVREHAEAKTLRQTEKTTDPQRGGRGCPSRDILKVGVSLTTSAIFFPFLVWGGFVFLPFDAPLLDGAPLRMLYALRCSVFAATPVILGWLAVGVTRVRSGIVRPILDETEAAALKGLGVHWKYTRDSVSLFLMYVLQLVVLAMYLSQEHLKLVPLLAIVFALGRSVYWVAAVLGSSVRAFGSGLSFLPALAMAVANLVFTFGSARDPDASSPVGRQRFWG
ncbi:transmembrane protein 79-like [Syngnathoides biaculeatus]|uniref:transmembrane protein 79-like n=1 Tax=Syngnathoides biaculeatus TaxID=300417 RepID=UPI002ADE8C7F|nr:transmembrane protein 79-like [Syngnathoides biaculeatus]